MKKIVLTALAAMMLLALVTGTAAALRSLSSSALEITLLSRALTFGVGGVFQVVCEVGVTITLNKRAFAKTERLNIAKAVFKVLNPRNECRSGKAFVLLEARGREIPFNVNYLGFTGTLPNITGLLLQVLGVEFLVELPGLGSCLIRSNALGFQRIGAAGRLEELTGEAGASRKFRFETSTVTTLSGTCPEPRGFELEGRFDPVRGATITLI